MILISVVIIHSCNIDEKLFPPKITLDSETGIYTVKFGREMVISPKYENAENATYSWTMNGEVIGISPSLSFMQEKVGEYYITITVTTEDGYDKEEIRVDVVDLEIPTVSIAGNKKMTVAAGTEVRLKASVRQTSLPTTFVWTVNGKEVSEEYSYIFKAEEIDNYTVKATASNEDSSHSDMVEIEVVKCR